jgi:hypothetical protein
MIWPWKREAAAQEEALKETERRIQETQSEWAVIYEEVFKGRRHREQNHIMDLIIGVARGHNK